MLAPVMGKSCGRGLVWFFSICFTFAMRRDMLLHIPTPQSSNRFLCWPPCLRCFSASGPKFVSEIVPILQLAGVDYSVYETERQGDAKTHVNEMGKMQACCCQRMARRCLSIAPLCYLIKLLISTAFSSPFGCLVWRQIYQKSKAFWWLAAMVCFKRYAELAFAKRKSSHSLELEMSFK